MDTEQMLLAAIHDCPDDDVAWRALADWLEEQGDRRGELLRLQLALRDGATGPTARRMEERLVEMIAAGARPCVPMLTSSIGMQLVLVPAGKFLMGSRGREAKRQPKEGPQHLVTITRPFYLGAHLVTQEQYETVMGTNPSAFSATGANRSSVERLDTRGFPVEMVSWHEALDFCDRLSALPEEERFSRRYGLPTEAQWEHACRGARSSALAFNVGNALGSAHANINGRGPYGGAKRGPTLQRPSTVGSYLPNVLGLYDMHGNVCEWCADWYDDTFYRAEPQTDPTGPRTGSIRVLRGGSWRYFGDCCRSAFRDGYGPTGRLDFVGFRVLMTHGE
jgi:uncharacterized protein (TIGR02996 family)